MICTPGELHGMNFGVHMAVLEEWNEGHSFGWQDALVVNIGGYYVRVAQPDSDGCLYIATYIGGGEGDLVSLRVYDPVPRTHDKGRGVKIPELANVDAKIGHEMWWHQGKEDSRDFTPKMRTS